ncbi:CDP-glucose 4,6-dehydratase [Chrysiogenes arsenatis]|uniref:CDP-glucose 4,6-dehydratase n=1 Tax=Chrysiogenes arsenatis TaxID=309797 RepID=UPI0004137E90
MNPNFWQNRTVFLTGHTGFKGGWIALWLSHMGAKVHGYALAPPTTPSFFTETRLEERLHCSIINDIRDLSSITEAMKTAKPSVVIHMAAQPLVRESYNIPIETFATNVMGTANLLEAVRQTSSVEAIVNITTDKCYENQEWDWPYRENDRLGGHDPYSSSKACAELVAAAYRKSFLAHANIHIASVRAGNVIGGGDWAKDRLIPDFLRALDAGVTLRIRSPHAIRPWQHVLEPLSGYLSLAEKLVAKGSEFADSWNFGPEESDAKPVAWIVEQLCEKIPNAKWEIEGLPQPHEAGLLKLDSAKAKARLGWKPRWSLETALWNTLDWHQAWKRGEQMAEFSIQQIEEYVTA